MVAACVLAVWSSVERIRRHELCLGWLEPWAEPRITMARAPVYREHRADVVACDPASADRPFLPRLPVLQQAAEHPWPGRSGRSELPARARRHRAVRRAFH
jgi:hypothetical protein